MTSPSERASATQAALRLAAGLSVLALLAGAPYLYYLAEVAPRQGASVQLPPLGSREVLPRDVLLLALLLVVTSLVGCFFSRRYRLGGLGSREQLRASAAIVVVGGLVLGAVSYLVLGRRLASEVPGLYPVTLGWALVMPLKSALVEETVARFGFMTLLAGLTRRPAVANVVQAVLFTGLGVKAFTYFGVSDPLLMAAGLGLSLVANLAFGAVYARYGLAAASLLHFVVDLKFVAHVVIVQLGG